MATSNEELLDALIRHQIGLVRVGGSIRLRAFEILDLTETQIRRAINDRLSGRTGLLERAAGVRILQALLDQVLRIRSDAWREVGALVRREIRDTSVAETVFLAAAISSVVPTVLEFNPVDNALIRRQAVMRPFLGRTLGGWLRSAKNADALRIRSTIVDGVNRSESGRQISTRVVGSSRRGGRNGVVQTARTQLKTVIASAVGHASAVGSRGVLGVNPGFFDRTLFVAVLDNSTTAICRKLSGQAFAVDDPQTPILPLHHNERSILMTVLDAARLSGFAAKSTVQQTLLRQFTDQRRIDRVTRRGDLPLGAKSQFDTFSQDRLRRLVGQTPEPATYNQFLKRQSAAVQDDILGRAKGKLFRRGKVTLDQFVDEAGFERTLDDLARSEPAAFRLAGLDPEEFID